MRVHWSMPEPIENWINILFFSKTEKYKTKVQIYNFDNELIKTILNEKIKSGEHNMKWDGTDNSGNKVLNGIYYYQITNGSYISPKRTLLL
ncbi:MAG: hypothetical protein KAS53_06950 [Candidatus Cloacimonetes bacterium]|nr:hypothetical protein [Candidatus Cloacimonadota bacterium]